VCSCSAGGWPQPPASQDSPSPQLAVHRPSGRTETTPTSSKQQQNPDPKKTHKQDTQKPSDAKRRHWV